MFTSHLHPKLGATITALIWSLAGGLAATVLFFTGVGGIGVLAFVLLIVVALLAGRRVVTIQAKIFLGLASVTALLWLVRDSDWVLVPAAIGVCLMLATAVLFARGGDVFNVSWSMMWTYATRFAGHFLLTPPWLAIGIQQTLPLPGGRSWFGGVRVVALATPILLALGLLLASADPVFADVLAPDVSPHSLILHLVLAALGGLAVACLWRCTVIRVIGAPAQSTTRLTRTEALVILFGVVTLFAGFVAIQVATAHGLGEATLADQGISVADYARSGYFQLLAAVFLTAVVLISIDALRSNACDNRRVEKVLSVVIVALALAIAVVALQRLALYVDTYGLTMLRLSCVPGAVWMVSLLVLTGGWVAGIWRTSHWLPAASATMLVATVLAFALVNPEAAVVQYNVSHQTDTGLDVDYLASLSDDAVPALVGALPTLAAPQRAQLTAALCTKPTPSRSWNTWSFVADRADSDLATLCERFPDIDGSGSSLAVRAAPVH
ncbi:MAG: DUF4173 domain-containing protein [Candidatus Nanopelagicales bacterium]